MDVQMVNGTDSSDAVQAIEQDRADLGLAYADAVFSSYSAPEGGGKSSHLRGVSLLEPLPLYFLARTSSGIRQASDIRGHRLAMVGSGALVSWTLGGLVLDALGVDTSTVTGLPSREAVQTALTDGTVDAVLLSGWRPSTAAVFGELRASVAVVPVDGKPIDQLRREYPFIRSVTVPLVLYPGQPRPVVTVGMDVLVICRSDLDEALVHDAIKELFVVYPRLSGVEATLRFLKLDEAPATPIPLHPGAARYFRERELSR
jgi:TRAP transporter TAXI family solute receptor